MRVLRSREIVPNLKSHSPQTPPKTLENGVIIEPRTPSKENPSNFPSYNTTQIGSDSGTILRRSLRLTSKSSSNSNEIIRNGLVLSRKRKSTVTEIDTNFENVQREGFCYTESQGFDFEVNRNIRVSGELGTGIDGIGKTEAENKLDSMVNEVSSELGSLRQSGQWVMVPKKGKGKRKLGVNVDFPAFEMVKEGETNEGCLKLRSGKKIASRKVESDDGDKSVHENAMGGENREIERVLNSKTMECIAMNDPVRELVVDENGSVQGRQRFSTKSKRKGSLVAKRKGSLVDKAMMMNGADCMKLELGTKVETSIGIAVSDAAPLTGALDLKGLESGQRADENGTGDKGKRRLVREDQGKLVENDLLSNCVNAVELDLPKVEKSKELENGLRADANGTVDKGIMRLIREEKGKGKIVDNDLFSNHVDVVELDTPKVENSNKLEDCTNGTGDKGRRKLSGEEKGKGKVVENVIELDSPKVEKSNESNTFGATRLADSVAVQNGGQVMENDAIGNATRTRERFRDIAKKNALRFAHFSSQEEEDNHVVNEAERELPPRDADKEMEDWPGPFSTAMKIIKDREMNGNVQQQNSSLDKSKSATVIWVPKKDQNGNTLKLLVPSLQELCMAILVKNAEAINSLDCVPDVLRHKLSHLLCDSRKMNNHFLDLLARGSPSEIRVRDSSWLTEEQFTRAFEGTDLSKLTVLQLDQCGRCMPDYILFATLAHSSNSLPALTTISLKGACRLSDVGLNALLSSAPALRSINLGQCSLLTSDGISSIADLLGSVLRELYLDDCQSIDAMLILPALSKLEQLEVLSLAGLQTVCDDFVSQFVAVRGHNMKELVLTDCTKLTDSSLKVISETCSGLCAIDLANLCKLTDSAIGYLANGCQSIQSLKLCRNAFSDEAIAAYLETCGESLEELSLNNISKVGHNTAISLSRRSRNLLSLDLSWCRNLTNEAVGLIVDSCLSLKMLKLFGCTQITNVFLDGHSNAQVQVVGLKMSPILEHIKVPDLLGPLHYSSVSPLM